jgi:hypothetical protein
MQLSDAEAREAYRAIVEILRELRLNWVTEQVESTIALGKPSRRKLEQDELPESMWRLVEGAPEKRRRGPPAVFVIADEFTASEQLEILVDAVKAAVIHTSEFAAAVRQFLPSGVSAEFRPELESSDGLALEPSDDAHRRDAVRHLGTLLAELLDDQTNANSPRITF